MEILFIGGVADGETFDVPNSARSSRHSFKLVGDFPADALRHHDYERRTLVIRRRHAEEDEDAEFMVRSSLPKDAVDKLVEAHLGVKVIS